MLLAENISINSPLFNTINTSGVNFVIIRFFNATKLVLNITENVSRILSFLFCSTPRRKNTLLNSIS